MKKKVCLLFALLVSSTMAWAWSGSGNSANDPILIASASDWNTLVTNVNNGTTYSGKYFRQTANISVTREVGTWETRPFSGTYDGNGYTITVTYTASGRYCAPFKVVSGATLKNIRTAGTINTAYQTAAGLIAGIPSSSGTVTVTNCRSSVTINSTFNGDTAHGGLIGNSRNTGKTVTLTGCVFDGQLKGSNSYNCGGLVGYNYANLTLTNCVFAPSLVSVKISDTEMTLARYNVAPTITNCYYTQTLGTAQGKKAYTISAGAGVTVSKAGSASSSYNVSNIYCYGTNKGIKYNGVLYGGSGDQVSLSLSGATKYVTTNGTLSGTTLTMTSANATINGTWNGSGTSSGSPYQIANTTDWNLLAAQVNAGTTQSGKYFQQRANITVSNIVGSYGSRAFSGTYDGGGYTITANINSTGTNGAAPFAWISGATIKNFTVTGTVKGGIHCAAVVGGVAGGTTNTISNIKATATVTCSKTHCGGILGHGNTSTTTLEGCVFAGSISASSYVGALWGWGESTAKLTIRNCLEAGTSYTATNFSPMGQSNGAPTYNITNSYYTNAASGSTSYITGGKKAYTITAATGVTVANAGSATTYSVSGITGYGTGIKYNGVLYGGSGDAVSLNLSGGSNGYLATAGTLSGTTLTMAAANTTISKQLPGPGTEGEPYTISSADDWSTLATNVGLGHTYSSKYIQQTANISVSTMVGAYDSKAFSGTYDGDGYTLTATVSAEDGAAPFANIDGATIKNLKTSGTSTVSRWYGAGLVGQVNGTCTITNCSSSTSIVSNHSVNCNTSCGGFVGVVLAGTLNISGCVFTGSFSYTNSGVHHGAGIIGQMNSSSSNATVTNCVFAPTSLTGVNTFYAMVGGNSDDNIARATITNSYYNSVAASACQSAEQGKQAYTITGATGVTVANAGSATTYSVSGITGYGTGIKYNDVLYGGSEDAVSLNLSGGSNGYLATAGSLSGTTLTMAAANTTISKQLAGSGTEGEPYTIGSADDWNTLATNVGLGHTYSSKYIQQTASFETSTMVGSSETNSFSGTYDGDGKTITFTKTATEADCAPFRYVYNATFKNIYTTGSITTSAKTAAGIISLIRQDASGTVTLTNCRSSITINSSVNGDGTHGGLVAFTKETNSSTQTLNLTGCLFDGQLLGENTTNCGGLVGWANGPTVNFTDCVFAPASVNIKTNEGESNTFSRNSNNSTINLTNCYYTKTLGTAQGKQAYNVTAAGDLAVANTGESTLYDVSGMTFYDTDKGFKYNDVVYAAVGEELKLTYNGSSVVKTFSFNRQSANTYTINSTDDVSTQVDNFNANPGSRLVFNVDYTGDLTFTAAEGEIDLNGHTITGKVYVQNNVLGKTVVFKNGTISGNIDGKSGTSDFYAGTLIMDNITLTGTLFNDGHYTILYSGTYPTVNATNNSSTPGTVLVYTAGSTITSRTGTDGLYSDVATAIPARATEKSYNQEWTIVMPHYNTVIAAEYDPWTYAADGNVLKAYGYGGYTEQNPLTLTLTAPADLKFSGGYKTATLEGLTAWQNAGATVPTIKYDGVAHAPSMLGSHTASITLGNAVAELDFEITSEVNYHSYFDGGITNGRNMDVIEGTGSYEVTEEGNPNKKGVWWDDEEQCAVFDGEAYLDIDNPLGNVDETTGFTITLDTYISSENNASGTFIRSTGVSVSKNGWQRLFDLSDGTINNYYMINAGKSGSNNNHLRYEARYNGGDKSMQSQDNSYFDQWITVTLVMFPGGNSTLYVNGTPVSYKAADDITRTVVNHLATYDHCYIGTSVFESSKNNADGFFFGKMRNFQTAEGVLLPYYNGSGYQYMLSYNTNGGSLVDAAFVSTIPSTLPTPTLEGCTFQGWYIDEALTTPVTTGAAVTQNTVLYAKWGTPPSVEMASTTANINDWSLSAANAVPGTTVTANFSGTKIVTGLKVRRKCATEYVINTVDDVATQVAAFNANPGSRLVFNCDYPADNTALTFTAAEGEIDFNGHTVNKVYVQNNVAGKVVVLRNGTATTAIEGAPSWNDCYNGSVVLDNITTANLFTDGHPYYLYSGTYTNVYVAIKDGYTGTATRYTRGATVTTWGAATSPCSTGTYSNNNGSVPGRFAETTGVQQWGVTMPHYPAEVVVEYDPWTYAADGNVLKAYGVGDYTIDNALTLTLTAPADLKFSGGYKTVTLEGLSAWEAAGVPVPTLMYDGVAHAPSMLGSHTASITADGETAELEFEITSDVNYHSYFDGGVNRGRNMDVISGTGSYEVTEAGNPNKKGVWWDDDEQCAVFDGEAYLDIDNPLGNVNETTGFTITLDTYISSENNSSGRFIRSTGRNAYKNGWQRLFDLSDGTINNYYMINAGKSGGNNNHLRYEARYNGGTKSMQSQNSNYFDRWVTVTLVMFPGGYSTLYVDGQRVSSKAPDATTLTVINNLGTYDHCYIGTSVFESSKNNADGFFFGKMRNFQTAEGVLLPYDDGSGPQYMLTYKTNGGNKIAATFASALPETLPTPTRNGYTFSGWYTDEALTIAATAGAAITQNTFLYAKWVVGPFNVTANKDPQNPSDYYSTFYHSTQKYLLPTGVEAYVGTVNNVTNNLTLTKIAQAEQVIPADNAVILKSTSSSYTLNVSDDEAVTFDVTNDLAGVDETTTIVGSAYESKVIYTLAAENNTLGFYKYYQQNSVPANAETRNSRTLGANKAFLPLEEAIAAGARGFVFEFDEETTGVDDVRVKMEEGRSEYFNLKGQRVNKPAKGLYIKDGKKVIIK